jgi:hypothetical protein
MMSVINKPFMVSTIMLNVIMLNVVMLSVIMLNVIMLNVVAPINETSAKIDKRFLILTFFIIIISIKYRRSKTDRWIDI